jgi:hypothetical protein
VPEFGSEEALHILVPEQADLLCSNELFTPSMEGASIIA